MPQRITKQPSGLYAVFSTVVDHFILYDATAEEIREHFRTLAVENADRQTAQGLMVTDEFAALRFEKDLAVVARIHGADEALKYRDLLSSQGAPDGVTPQAE